MSNSKVLESIKDDLRKSYDKLRFVGSQKISSALQEVIDMEEELPTPGTVVVVDRSEK